MPSTLQQASSKQAMPQLLLEHDGMHRVKRSLMSVGDHCLALTKIAETKGRVACVRLLT